MTQSNAVHLLDLPDEILMSIMSHVASVDLLYSCIGACKRLDRLARDHVHTRSVDITASTSTDAMLDRFCDDILPRIHHKIESLTLDASTLKRVLHSLDYPRLSELSLCELTFYLRPDYFHGEWNERGWQTSRFVFHRTVDKSHSQRADSASCRHFGV